MRKIQALLFISIFCCATSVSAQYISLVENKGEIGFMGGASFYRGDIASDILFYKPNIPDKDLREEKINVIAANDTALGKLCLDNFEHEMDFDFKTKKARIYILAFQYNYNKRLKHLS